MPNLDIMISAPQYEEACQLMAQREPRGAVELFNLAESFGHDPDQCAAGRWYCWMLLGEFDQAWRESDAIAARGAPDPNRLWDGQPLDGKRVIVRCLHGFGDAIQFIRYAGLVRDSASYLIVQTHPEMVRLLSRLTAADEVISWDNRADWDSQVEVMELPRVFGTTVTTIPANTPYLSVTAAARKQSAAHLPRRQKVRVGVLWGSSDWDPRRSICFDEFSKLMDVPGVTFCSFQRGAARQELQAFGGTRPCWDTADASPDILDTAADLINMDLLISVDTMAAHLAGALAIPVWTLLPYEADWRWMLDREDTPWYRTMRLFRQPARGTWSSVIDRVMRELGAWAASRHVPRTRNSDPR